MSKQQYDYGELEAGPKVVTKPQYDYGELEQKPAVDSTDKTPSLWDRAKSLLPSPRGMATMAGAAIGGAATLPAYLLGPEAIAATGLAGGAGAVGAGALYDTIMTGKGQPPESTPTSDFMSGALQEAIGPSTAKGIAGSAEAGIPKAVERAVGPSNLKEIKAVKDAASTLSKDFPLALTDKSLNEKVASKVSDLSAQLESAWNRLPPTVQIPTTQARIALQQERRSLYNTNGQIVKGAEKLEGELTDMIDYLNQNPTLSPSDLRNNRQIWDRMVKWYRPDVLGSTVAPEKERVYRIAANGLRDTINRTFPSIGAINDKLSAYIPASKIIDTRIEKEAAVMPSMNLRHWLPEVGGATAGGIIGRYLMPGMGATEGAVLGAGITGLRQLMNTTAWQTASIPIKRQVVRLMNKGATQEALGILAGQAPSGIEHGINLLTGQPTEAK